ncbi:MAG: membrane protein insertase YidC [Desulfovibrionaceae bacterium]|nr:membrane protein insertase YidC [Desulfovibrionaceae bacterium]
MDTKRLILAIIISVVIFLGWNALSLYMGWAPQQPEPAARNATAPATPAPVAAGGAFDAPSKVERPLFTPGEGRPVTVETPLYKAVFHSNGGILQRFELKHYTNGVREDSGLVNLVSEAAAAQAPMGLLVGGLPSWMDQAWALEGGDLNLDQDGNGVIRLIGEVGGLRLTRELLFEGSSYLIREKLRVSSDELKAANLIFTFSATALPSEKAAGIMASLRHWVFGGPAPAPEESAYNPTRVAWLRDNSFKEENSPGTLTEGKTIKPPLSWMAVMNNFFMGAVSMDDPDVQGVARMVAGNVFSARMGKSVTVSQGQDATLECVYFLGPKDSTHLNAAPNNLGRAIDYGFFSIVANPLIWLLRFLYGYVHNYGLAIILMTVLIKILFWPLSQKSYKSMQQMKQLQPMMVKLREKYADDKETMNREIMQLYKTYKVNPASGCLPILIQLPVFFGLYQALLNSIELRHAPFIATLPFTDLPWLVDLSSRDPYFITPLVMGATMFLQQKLTPMPGDPMQARIMMFMPVIFTVLFLGFPSGLVVYWLVNNVISIGQQWWQLRRTA